MHEVNRDDLVRAESWVASADSKRLRVTTTLLVADTPVAAGDSLYLHVDTAVGKVSSFPDDRARLLARMEKAHDEVSASR